MKKAIFGFGGHAREVAKQITEDVTFFVNDEFANKNALPISSFNPNEYQMMIGIGNCTDRQKILSILPKETKFFTFVHPTALILDNDVEIGEGSFIGAYSILTTNIKIGKHAILNRMNQIGHDSTIGDFFSAMPGSIVSGNCTIGDRFYLGSNSCVKEKIKISNDVTIGLNSGVVKDILESGIYGGVPAKKIRIL